MHKNLPRCSKAFTLIELLVVIGILTILFAIVLIAINPARQFSQANNTQRRSDINAILNAVQQYAADNRGTLPTGISTTATNIGSGAGNVDLCDDLVPTYIAQMPVDPKDGSWTSCDNYDTTYNISKGDSNRITVAAPSAELDEVITVTR